MSLIRAYHFDNNVWPPGVGPVGTNLPTISSVQSRTGTYSIRGTQYDGSSYTFNQYVSFALPLSFSEFFLQVCMYLTGTPEINNGHFLRWKDSSGNTLGGLHLNPTTRLIEVYTGNFITKVVTGTQVLSVSTWHVIEVHVIIEDSGSISVRVGANSDSDFSGDTKPGTGTSINSFDLAAPHLSSNVHAYFDDIVFNDTTTSFNNSWPNGAKVFYCLPTADGTTKQWTPTPAGLTHWTAIDEIPPSATDYLRATTTNLVDSFEITDLPAIAGTIKAVIPEVYAWKGSSDSPTRLALGLDVGGSVEYSSDLNVPIVQSLISEVFPERPGGGNFTASDVNSMKLLVKSAP